MKISQFKSALQLAKPENNPIFLQTSGLKVAAHYHITEIGLVLKNYVDCGGIAVFPMSSCRKKCKQKPVAAQAQAVVNSRGYEKQKTQLR